MAGTVESTEAKTAPWQPDELCRVGTAACVYSFADKVLVVRLPGGRTATVAELRDRGHVVTLPRRIRGWSGE